MEFLFCLEKLKSIIIRTFIENQNVKNYGRSNNKTRTIQNYR